MLAGTPRISGGSSGGGGGGTINGTATATQVAYGASSNTLTSDANFTTTTNSFSILRNIATGQDGTYQISDNILAFGIKGILAASLSTGRVDGSIFGDLSGIGLDTHSGIVGALNTSGGSHATTTYTVTDIGDLGSIQNEAKDGSGANYQTNLSSAGFRLNGAYTLPLADGPTGYFVTTDGAGNWGYSAGGGGSTPGLPAVLAVDNTNNGISIFGTDLLKAHQKTTVLFNDANLSIVATDQFYNALVNGYNETAGVLSGASIGFTQAGMPTSNGTYSTLGTGFVYTPIGSPALDDLTVTGTYNGAAANPFYRIDSNNSYYVTISYVGGSVFSDHATLTWNNGGPQTGTLENYTSGTTLEITNATGAPLIGETLDDGMGNTAIVTVEQSGPFDTYSWNDGFGGGVFFSRIIAGVAGAANSGTIPTFAADNGHTIGDQWIATGANSANVNGFLLDYGNDSYAMGDISGAMNGNKISVDDLNGLSSMGSLGDKLTVDSLNHVLAGETFGTGSSFRLDATNGTAVFDAKQSGGIDNPILSMNSVDDTIFLGTDARNGYGLAIGGTSGPSSDNIFLGDQNASGTPGFRYYGSTSTPTSPTDGFVIDKADDLYTMGNTGTGGTYLKADNAGQSIELIAAGNGASQLNLTSIPGSESATLGAGGIGTVDPMVLNLDYQSRTATLGSAVNGNGTVLSMNDAAQTISMITGTSIYINIDGSSNPSMVIGDGTNFNTLDFNSDPGTILNFIDLGSYFQVNDPSGNALFQIQNSAGTVTMGDPNGLARNGDYLQVFNSPSNASGGFSFSNAVDGGDFIYASYTKGILTSGSGGMGDLSGNGHQTKYLWNDSAQTLTLNATNGVSVNSSYILPTADGTAGQVVTTNGSGVTSFGNGQLPHTIFTPTTGSTVNLVKNQYNAINPSGAILALTLNFPSSPANNDVVEVKFDKGVTTVTYSGGTIVGGITTAALGDYVKFVYDSGTSTWY